MNARETRGNPRTIAKGRARDPLLSAGIVQEDFRSGYARKLWVSIFRSEGRETQSGNGATYPSLERGFHHQQDNLGGMEEELFIDHFACPLRQAIS